MLTTNSGDWTTWMVIVGPILLAAVIAWALLKNRKVSASETVADDQAAAQRIREQDVIDKARNGGGEI